MFFLPSNIGISYIFFFKQALGNHLPSGNYLGDYQVTLWSWVPINGDLMVHIYVRG